MPSWSSRLRLIATASGVVVLGLLGLPAAEAAAGSDPSFRTRRVVCDPHRPTRREQVHMGLLPPARQAVLRNLRTRLQHTTPQRLTSDEDAIPANVFVAGLPDDGRVEVALEPLDILVSSHATLPIHRPTARRSPRGPPVLG